MRSSRSAAGLLIVGVVIGVGLGMQIRGPASPSARPSETATPAAAATPSRTATPSATARVVLSSVGLGDSITYNTGSWFRRTCASGVLHSCLNAGRRGDTTTGMLARLDVDVLALHPDLVVVMGGTNDLPGRSSTKQIIRRLDLIVDRIERAGAVAVLCTIAPRDRFGSEALALNRAIRRYASRGNVPLLDLYDVIGDGHGAYQRGLTPDGVHPNWRAAGLMAVAAERQLRVLLKPVRGQARSGRVP